MNMGKFVKIIILLALISIACGISFYPAIVSDGACLEKIAKSYCMERGYNLGYSSPILRNFACKENPRKDYVYNYNFIDEDWEKCKR